MLKISGLLLFITFSFSTFALPAPIAEQASWYCGLETVMTGEPGHFVGMASDGWKAESDLECFDGIMATRRRVAVSFSSLEESFGADSRSRLKVSLAVQSSREPDELVVHMVAASKTGQQGLIWKFEGRDQTVEAHVVPRNSQLNSHERAKISTSLRSGMLMIRPVQ